MDDYELDLREASFDDVPEEQVENLVNAVESLQTYIQCIEYLKSPAAVTKYEYEDRNDKLNQCAVGIIYDYLDFLYNTNNPIDTSYLNNETFKEYHEILIQLYDVMNVALCIKLKDDKKQLLIYEVPTYIKKLNKNANVVPNKILYNSFLYGKSAEDIFKDVAERWFDNDEKRVWAVLSGLEASFFLGEE